MKVREILERHYGQHCMRFLDGRYYGIEIEVEGANLPRAIPSWTAKQDGSLRPNPQCLEYISTNPTSFKERRAHLQAFADATKESRFNLSHRCSVHVHRNITHLPVDRLFKVIATFFMLEPLLSGWCGKSRAGNRFCLRAMDCGDHGEKVARAIYGGFTNVDPAKFKYSSLNIATIPRMGTLEFRGLAATVDTDRILKWIDIIECLFKYSLKDEPVQVMQERVFSDFPALVKDVFGKHAEELFTDEAVQAECEYAASINYNLCTWEEAIKKEYFIGEDKKKVKNVPNGEW